MVPVALVAINFAAVCLLGWLGVRLARASGRATGWALFLPFYPGFVVSIARDLTEIVATCCLASALLGLISKRYVVAGLLLCCAVLSRETTVLVVLCLLVASLPRVPSRLRAFAVPPLVAIVPLIVFAAWQGWLWLQWGALPVSAGGTNFARPLSGLMDFIEGVGAWPPVAVAGWIRVVELLSWGLVTAAVVFSLRSTAAEWPVRIAWVGYGCLALVLSTPVWASDWHILRALVEWHVLGLLILLGVRSSFARLSLVSTIPVWFFTFLQAPAD